MPKKEYQTSLFIFRRDLRLDDNTALLKALDSSEEVIPVFIFDPRQVGAGNKYRSKNCIQFMIESLEDLAKQLKSKKAKLFFFKGQAETVIARIAKSKKCDAVFINKDYTPFALKRDKAIAAACKKLKIEYFAEPDALLNDPDTIATKSGKPYGVFTPFYTTCRVKKVDKPKRCTGSNFFKGALAGGTTSLPKVIGSYSNKDLWVHGGTSEAKTLLTKISKLKNYKKTRDFPDLMTSNLSAHNKFGTVSIREVYHKIASTLGKSSGLIPQLYWRDFFYHVAYHSPFVFGEAYQEKYKKLWWSKSKADFKKWCEGKTGFPIVDAGMRQLNATGYMHNRARMIVGSFLTKDLHINWLWGEKYFAQNLVDYDPCVNNGSWQWAASTGCDAQPYFRIFNPWLQQKKFDPDCTYIKTWIPELKNTPKKVIHNWEKETSPPIKGYPRPMVNHKEESREAIKIFKKA